jgi:hypothetical protein
MFLFLSFLPLPLMRGPRCRVLSFGCYIDMAARVRVRGSSMSGGRGGGGGGSCVAALCFVIRKH